MSPRVRRILAHAKMGEDDFPTFERRVYLSVVATASKKPRYLLCTKLQSFDQYFSVERVPSDWGVLGHDGIPSRATIAAATRLFVDARKIVFVGDLDPLDLAVFLEWNDALDDRLTFGGVDDRWLDAARKHRTCDELPTIVMNEFERTSWSLLKKFDPEICDRIGPNATALLDQAHKLEIEGALNPAFYRAEHADSVARILFRSRPCALEV